MMDLNDMLDDVVRSAGKVCADFESIATGSDQRTTLAYALAAVRATRRTLADRERELEQAIADASDEPRFEVDQLGLVQVKRSPRRTKWDHDGIVRAVVQTYTNDTGTNPDVTRDVIERYRACVSTGAAKKAFTEFTGHDLDEFCQKEPGAITVRIDEPERARRLDGF